MQHCSYKMYWLQCLNYCCNSQHDFCWLNYHIQIIVLEMHIWSQDTLASTKYFLILEKC
jgi:hypothetical protein